VEPSAVVGGPASAERPPDIDSWRELLATDGFWWYTQKRAHCGNCYNGLYIDGHRFPERGDDGTIVKYKHRDFLQALVSRNSGVYTEEGDARGAFNAARQQPYDDAHAAAGEAAARYAKELKAFKLAEKLKSDAAKQYAKLTVNGSLIPWLIEKKFDPAQFPSRNKKTLLKKLLASLRGNIVGLVAAPHGIVKQRAAFFAKGGALDDLMLHSRHALLHARGRRANRRFSCCRRVWFAELIQLHAIHDDLSG
jgi:hypothetical protein